MSRIELTSILSFTFQFFRKLSITNTTKASTSSECNAKYKPQKNHASALSPMNTKTQVRSIRKKAPREEEEEDIDMSIHPTTKHRKSYLKNCIKNKLNKNYDRQVNHNEDSVVFTDNKIYISLNGPRSSLPGSLNNSYKMKDRRVIYPTTSGFMLSGFLRDYDFNYDYKAEEEAAQKKAQESQVEEKLKFNMMEAPSPAPSKRNQEIVFEKVKFDSTKKYLSYDMDHQLSGSSHSSLMHVNHLEDDYNSEANHDSILTNTTFIPEWGSFNEDPEEDADWDQFVTIRKHRNNPFAAELARSNNKRDSNNNDYGHFFRTNDSGFGEQTSISDNLRTLEDKWLDDEDFDNSFNEELERRVETNTPSFRESKRNYNNNYYEEESSRKSRFK